MHKAPKRDGWLMRQIIRMAGSFPLILLMFGISLIVGALSFSFFESDSFWNGIWWSSVTANTIGYGDFFPKTVGGRISAMLLFVFWIWIMIPVIIVRINSAVNRDKNQLTHEEQEWIIATLLAVANKLEIQVPAPPHDTEHGDVSQL